TLNSLLGTGSYRDVTRTVKVKAGKSCALFIAIDSSSCSCDFNYSKFPIPELKNAGQDQTICSGDIFNPGTNKVSNFRYQWTPGGEFNSDTIAQPTASILNTDTATISKSYILTTYKGQCFSKDTVLLQIYKLPEIALLQRDTILCQGNTFKLKAKTQGGTGKHAFAWSPSAIIEDSSSLITLCSPHSNVVIYANVTDEAHCTAKDSLTVKVQETPIAKIYDTATCQGQPLWLRDSSLILKDTLSFIKWTTFGYDTIGIKQWSLDLKGNSDVVVRLIVGTDFGCKDTTTKSISLQPFPVAGFTSLNVCAYDSVKFINTSTLSSGKISQIKWNLGDGNSSYVEQPSHFYLSTDTFDVQLVAISDANCTDTSNKQIVIYHVPKADFNFIDNCLDDSSYFKNTSIIGGGSILTQEWRTDSTLSLTKDFQYLYQSDSIYKIDLKVISDKGCIDSIQKSIQIYSLPIANFKVDTVCEGQKTHVFDNSRIRKGSINSYQYDISDGSAFSGSSFEHLFLSGDTFKLRLITISDHACIDTIEKNTVVHPRIQPDFLVNDVCLYDSARLIDKSSFIHTNIASVQYKFGDGDSITAFNISHKYLNQGAYTIKQEVLSTEFCKYDTSKLVNIYPIPIADFKDSNKCFDNQFELKDASSISSGSISNYYWRFGDGDTNDIVDPIHIFDSAGLYLVVHKVKSDKGCIDSIQRQLESYPPVIVDFDLTDRCDGESVEFIDKSIVPSSFIKKHTWDFGDNQGSNLSNPIHKYDGPGSYNINLSIQTNYNCLYDSTKSLVIFPTPVADFRTDPSVGTIVNPEIQIIDQSIGADTVFYDLGNGLKSYERNLSSMYPDSGTFYIKQFVTNSFGCKDTIIKKVQIRYLFVFNVPSAFSPNDDGSNDTYGPGGIGFSSYEMWIYDRWGEMVYFTDNGTPWNGQYEGQSVMQGVYMVKFKVRDFKGRYHYYSASITLLL
ncbi:MAG: gliding motility-associated C-terminal domain-containing protein, partial [Bacteroidia bacterium]|nr:gliding motility-associated C-terminal domain-containing protein [Bacteroidia bacterium]